MAKLKSKPIVKYDGQDKYVFINGWAQIPGTKAQIFRITLKEFNEMRRATK